MKYIALGKTGLTVSRLVFGSLTLGPLQKNLSVDEAAEIYAEAFRLGVNLVDTAQLYRTYPQIRAGIRLYGGDIMIATKSYAYTAKMAEDAVEEARRALDRDIIDIFLLHEQESEHTLRGHGPALERLLRYKHDGIIHAVGLSTHHVAGVHAAVDAGLDIVHPLINIAGLGIQGGGLSDMEAAVERAMDAGLGVYVMKALGGGNLISVANQALAYALGKGHALAIGMSSIEEVRANVCFLENGRFPESDLTIIRTKKRKILIENHCSGCGKCISACRAKALEIKGSVVVCNHESCILCGYCSAKCESFCIKII